MLLLIDVAARLISWTSPNFSVSDNELLPGKLSAQTLKLSSRRPIDDVRNKFLVEYSLNFLQIAENPPPVFNLVFKRYPDQS